MKNIKIAITFGLIISVILSLSRAEALSENVRENVFRLHIIANSDEANDQELKLKVRDALLEENSEYFEKCAELSDAVEFAEKNIDKFRKTAEDTVRENGYSYPVSVSVGYAYFDNREYDGFTLPAGEYKALKVVIGEGKGKNWWCVMFPAVCVSAAADLDTVLADDSNDFVTSPNKYKIAFKSVEIYQKIKKYLSE